MKNRCGFVTNSSSSSFIIRNTTDKEMTPEDIAMSFFKRILEDVKESIQNPLSPGEQIEIECSDHYENYFDTFIHNEARYWNYSDEEVDVEFLESHH